MSITNRSQRRGSPGDCKSYSAACLPGGQLWQRLSQLSCMCACGSCKGASGKRKHLSAVGLSLFRLCFLSPQTKLSFSGWLARNTQAHITKHPVLLKPITCVGAHRQPDPTRSPGSRGSSNTSPADSQHKPLLVKSLSQPTLWPCPLRACHFPPTCL